MHKGKPPTEKSMVGGVFDCSQKPPAVLVVTKSFSFAQFPPQRRLPCAKGAVSEAD